MANEPKQKLTDKEYLEFERASERKHEFYRGEVYLMNGASRPHNLITVSILCEMRSQLKGRPCEVYSGDMRVKVNRTGLYTYPDVVAVCGEINFEDDVVDTLLNPQLVIEVLSRSTETYDRSTKFRHYQKLQSLQEYVIVSQKTPLVEVYQFESEERWTYKTASSLADEVELESIGCRLKMSEIYDRVDLDDDLFPLKVIEEVEPCRVGLLR